MHQLGNRPQKFEDPWDARNDPDDELEPYCISAKSLVGRKVFMADGGAQHTVELVLHEENAIDADVGLDKDEESEIDQLCEDVVGNPTDAWLSTDQECIDDDREVLVVTTSDQFWCVQLEAIYRRRNPHKLENVRNLLLKYTGREATLYTKVCKTYDLDPTKFYADPEVWAGEDKDVKSERPTPPEFQEGIIFKSEHASLFGGLVAAAPASHQSVPSATELFKSSGSAVFIPATLPSTACIFQFGAAVPQSQDASHSNSSSEEDCFERSDRHDAKRKRSRTIKSSTFTKRTHKDRRNHR
jgi:hypothetical protein